MAIRVRCVPPPPKPAPAAAERDLHPGIGNAPAVEPPPQKPASAAAERDLYPGIGNAPAVGPPPLFSVVMPLYNMAAKGLDRAIESVIGQTCPDWELVIVDDGSTDGGHLVAEWYAARDARIRVHRGPNRGLPAARNAGYWLARGEYVAHLDPDDEYLPGALALHAAALQANPYAGAGFGKAIRNNETAYNWGVTEIADGWEAVRERCLPPCQSVVVRRSLLQLVGGADVRTPILRSKAQDWEQWTRCFAVADVAILPEPVYRLHWHPDSQTARAQASGAWQEANALVQARAERLHRARERVARRKTRLLLMNHEAFSRGAQTVMLSLLRALPPGEFEVCVGLHQMVGELLPALRALCPVEQLTPELVEWADVVHDHCSNVTLRSGLPVSTEKCLVTDHGAVWRYPGAARVAQVWRNAPPAPGSDLPLEFNPRCMEILNPMDLPEPEGYPEAPPLVLGLLPAQHIKGIDLWLAAAERIWRERPETRFVVAGVRPWLDHLWKQTAAEAERLRGIGMDLELLEPQPREEVARLLRRASVLMHLSRSESACLAVVEAQAAGTPVVCSHAWGMPQHLHCGAVVPVGNVQAAANAVLRLIGTRVPAATRERIRRLHDPRRAAGAYAECYRWIRLLQEARR